MKYFLLLSLLGCMLSFKSTAQTKEETIGEKMALRGSQTKSSPPTETRVFSSIEEIADYADQCAKEGKYEIAFNLYHNTVIANASSFPNERVVAAKNAIGLYYEKGLGTPVNLDSAKTYYQAAANTNFLYFFRLGDKFNKDKNYGEAFKNWKVAADMDNTKNFISNWALGMVQLNLAYYYSEGLGVEKNPPNSAHYYEKAANNNFEPGMYFLAICYENGNGVTKNIATAVKWYKKAASGSDKRIAQGATDALARLGQ